MCGSWVSVCNSLWDISSWHTRLTYCQCVTLLWGHCGLVTLSVVVVGFVFCPVHRNNSKTNRRVNTKFGRKVVRVVCNLNTQLQVIRSRSPGRLMLEPEPENCDILRLEWRILYLIIEVQAVKIARLPLPLENHMPPLKWLYDPLWSD